MNSVIKVGVVGAGGRVGLELEKLIKDSTDLEPTLGIGHRSLGFKENRHHFSDSTAKELHVVIDFSTPELLEKTIEFCLKQKVPLVSGTTGLSSDQLSKLETAAKTIPVLWAPNMSLGVAVLKKALNVFKTISHFDFQVEEWHHRHKKDSPSGTAVMLKTELEKIIEKSTPPTMVMRAGGIYGVHKIYATSDEEIIQFEHTAINRTVFARGALTAARWIIKQKPGSYSMSDILNG